MWVGAGRGAGGRASVFFARPTALCAPQRVERPGQIEGTEATCGPRRPKGFVMAAQGHGEHPAAA